ncbi:hypothetical protein BYT27DRAFT_7287685 [Phlegmacium glaucopus]|nr:hypothetical protein BYT27DRAFT_7287685 [Phlegmacium glaucopus]
MPFIASDVPLSFLSVELRDAEALELARVSANQYTGCNMEFLLFSFTEYFDLPMLGSVETQDVCYNYSIAFGVCGTWYHIVADKQVADKQRHGAVYFKAPYLVIDGLVMGLIVLKIVMVYLEVRPVMAHSGRENKFRPLPFIFFILIESGSVTFVAQLFYVILYVWQFAFNYASGPFEAYVFIGKILTQVPLNGIVPTIILVREALGMSYNDITPLSQTIESLHFAHNDDTSGNSNQEVEQLDAQASDAQDIVEVNRSSNS